MGIDVYLEWNGMTDAEEKARYTGFSITAGKVGYLREAYHGGPYATAVLICEDWDNQPEGGFVIPAVELKRRLPAAVLCSLYRHEMLRGDGDVARRASLAVALQQIFDAMDVKKDRTPEPSSEQVRAVLSKIEKRELPDYALAFADFVALAERKEKETGAPCRVVVSA